MSKRFGILDRVSKSNNQPTINVYPQTSWKNNLASILKKKTYAKPKPIAKPKTKLEQLDDLKKQEYNLKKQIIECEKSIVSNNKFIKNSITFYNQVN